MKTLGARIFAIVGLLVLAMGVLPIEVARADSWAPAETETTESLNGAFRFTVEPSPISSSLSYFQDEVAASVSGEPVERTPAFGMLERKVEGDTWSPVWAMPLVNAIAPVSTIVSDDGRYVVTFDNWHSVGFGPNVIVIYGPNGAHIRSLALTDLFPQHYMDALPRSVSSLQWRARNGWRPNVGTRFSDDNDALIVDVLVPSIDPRIRPRDRKTVPFRIQLADGSVTVPATDLWEPALAAAREENLRQDRNERERIAYMTDPLVVPDGCEVRDWHRYLEEAFARLDTGPLMENFTSRTVLFPTDHDRHSVSVGWLRDRMDDPGGYPRNEAFVSPCEPDALAAAIADITEDAAPGAWPDATFYISAPRSHWGAIERDIAPTGAKIVWLDPDSEIVQRPDRVPGSREAERALDAMMERILEEAGAIDTEL